MYALSFVCMLSNMQTAALFVISVNSECAAGMSLTCHGTDGRPFKKASNTAVK